MKNPGDISILFIPQAATGHRNFLVLVQIKTMNRIGRESGFGPIRAKKWTGLQSWCAKLAEKNSRARKFARATVRVTTPSFSKTPTETNSKFVAARSLSSRVELITKDKGRARHSGARGPSDFQAVGAQRTARPTSGRACSANLLLAQSEGMANTHEIDDPSGTSEPPHRRG